MADTKPYPLWIPILTGHLVLCCVMRYVVALCCVMRNVSCCAVLCCVTCHVVLRCVVSCFSVMLCWCGVSCRVVGWLEIINNGTSMWIYFRFKDLYVHVVDSQSPFRILGLVSIHKLDFICHKKDSSSLSQLWSFLSDHVFWVHCAWRPSDCQYVDCYDGKHLQYCGWNWKGVDSTGKQLCTLLVTYNLFVCSGPGLCQCSTAGDI